PYWSHRRDESYSSVTTAKPPPITLEDHTEEPSEQSAAVWAQGVEIEEYVLVSGQLPSVGKFVVWVCRIGMLDGGAFVLRKRYSEFDDLRRKLLMTFPHAGGAMPPLPPKSLLYKFRPSFLEKRRVGLAYFLNCVLLNPDLASAPVTKEFIF
ncbi:Phox homologous domain-containing protein, partial [Usnea florida]